MGADWTRNLSRHRVFKGGSDFIACRRTVIQSVSVSIEELDARERRQAAVPVTVKSWPGSMRPTLGRTQYLKEASANVSR